MPGFEIFTFLFDNCYQPVVIQVPLCHINKITIMDTSANAIFPKGASAPADYFTGTAWVNTLVPNDAILHSVIANVIFEPGARNNWHTHPGGQLLIVTDGTGYYQEKGKPAQLIKKGDLISILPDVVHWPGASHDSELTHIAINPNTKNGASVWLDGVTDEEYNSARKS
jgi:quercetin dioxygenase-like cupin family protein